MESKQTYMVSGYVLDLGPSQIDIEAISEEKAKEIAEIHYDFYKIVDVELKEIESMEIDGID